MTKDMYIYYEEKRKLFKLAVPVSVLKWLLRYPAKGKSIGAGCAHRDLSRSRQTHILCSAFRSVALQQYIERGQGTLECKSKF